MLYENIFLSLTGQDDETRLITEAMRIVTALNAHLSVIHINDPNAGMGHMMPDTNPKVTKEDIVDSFRKAGFGAFADKITFIIIEEKPFARAIAEGTRKANLLIMGHHHRNMLENLLSHGTDEKVADHIRCPILLVPAEESADS
jgi:nucleotide-binding universal stress UspA family protein